MDIQDGQDKTFLSCLSCASMLKKTMITDTTEVLDYEE